MKACYDGNLALEMPRSYVPVSQDEMEYVDGGIGLPVVVAVIAGCVGTYVGGITIGREAAKKCRNLGLTVADYQKLKWGIRSSVFVLATPILGSAIMLGFENELYS